MAGRGHLHPQPAEPRSMPAGAVEVKVASEFTLLAQQPMALRADTMIGIVDRTNAVVAGAAAEEF